MSSNGSPGSGHNGERRSRRGALGRVGNVRNEECREEVLLCNGSHLERGEEKERAQVAPPAGRGWARLPGESPTPA